MRSADAIKVTLGPRESDRRHRPQVGLPTVINCGVVVAREIELPDPLENMGAHLLKAASARSKAQGTTTSTILAQAIETESLRNLAAGANPMLMKRGIDAASQAVVEELKKLATPVVGPQDLEHIATISANEPEIGRLPPTRWTGSVKTE